MDIVHQLIAAAPPEKVYAALTEPAQLAAWFTRETEAEARVGADAAFHFNRGTIRVQITELEPGRKVVWKVIEGLPGWEGVTGEITWLLATPYPGTLVQLTHTGWLGVDGPYPSVNHKWGSLMDLMRAFVEGRAVEPA